MPHDIARTRAPARVLARAPASASARARVAAVAGALAFAASAVGPPASAQQRLLPVPSVDPKRYAGTWYEVARLPNRFQSQCAGDVVARYAPREDGSQGLLAREDVTASACQEPRSRDSRFAGL